MTAARMQQFSPQAAGARKRATSTRRRDGSAPPAVPQRAMSDAVDGLIAILDLEELEVNVFRGRSPQENRQRVFGGQVAGQALVAAGRTVEGGSVHSLHAYFLRPGDPTKPILYQVDRIRDGRTFTTRRVVAIQHGQAIFNLAASFQPEETGPSHQIPMPDAPDPDSAAVVRGAHRAGEGLHAAGGAATGSRATVRSRCAPSIAGNPFKPIAAPATPARLDPRQRPPAGLVSCCISASSPTPRT